MPDSAAVPRYQRIKRHIVRFIESGGLRPGDRVPSENALVKELGVSRMTVNRALRELTGEGLLVRVQGAGTFVAERRPHAELLQLRNIAEEIRDGGQRHSQRLELLQTADADEKTARDLDIEPGTAVFHSIIVHMADGEPVQIEDRYVNPAVVPDYLSVDFDAKTPNEHLMRAAALSEIEHIVEAVRPAAWEQKLLRIGATEPCLQLRRRTWSGGRVASAARLIHPGRSHRFGTRFAYHPDGRPNRSAV